MSSELRKETLHVLEKGGEPEAGEVYSPELLLKAHSRCQGHWACVIGDSQNDASGATAKHLIL